MDDTIALLKQLTVPTRHIHNHGAIIHRLDFEQAVQLVEAVVRRLDADTVSNLSALCKD